MRAPAELPRWDATSLWPGGFIASAEVRRDQVEPGRAPFWVRTETALIDGEPVSDLARFAGLLDIANGLTSCVVHDRNGPVGTLSLALTVRPSATVAPES